MLEKLVSFSWAVSAQADADSIAAIFLPSNVGFTVLGVAYCGVHGSTVSAATIDVQDDSSDLAGCVAMDVVVYAGDYAAADNSLNCHAAAGSLIELDLNITGGGNCTGIFTLYGFFDEK